MISLHRLLDEFSQGMIHEQVSFVGGFYPFEVDEYEYLAQARKELNRLKAQKETSRLDYNNVMNFAKQAMHCRVDTLLKLWGIKDLKDPKGRRHFTRFPAKIEALRKAQITAPRFLERINIKRNSMEHDYELVSGLTVEDYVDTVELFLDSSKKYLCPELEAIVETLASYELSRKDWEEGPDENGMFPNGTPYAGAASEWVTLTSRQEQATIALNYCLPQPKNGKLERGEREIKAAEDMDTYLVALGLLYSTALE